MRARDQMRKENKMKKISLNFIDKKVSFIGENYQLDPTEKYVINRKKILDRNYIG